jgi:hypothetical protein
VGKDQRIGEQDAEDARRCADDRRIAARKRGAHDQLRNGAGHDRAEIGEGHPARAPDALEVGAEHPHREHVEQDVEDVAVQEAVGHQLPRRSDRQRAQSRAVARPQREPLHHQPPEGHLQEEAEDVGDDQRLGERGHGHDLGGIG